MPTLQNAADRAGLIARLDRVTPDTKGQWGVMNVSQMLAHCADNLRMAVGDLPVKAKSIPFFRYFPLKHLALYVLPFPKNAPTAPELKSRAPKAFDAERVDIRTLLPRLDPASFIGRVPDHPIFGSFTPAQWGTLGFRHLDHHLRQFGV